MTLVSRPTSPHLSIYKPQISSITSITHRLTGLALYAGAVAMVAWLVLAAYYPAHYAKWHACAISPVGRVVLLVWTLSFFYHLANGIRHLFWDIGKGYDIKTASLTGWFVILFTLAATAGAWLYVYQQAGLL